MALEKTVEKALIRECKKVNWICYKFTSPGRRSVPDRLVIKTNGDMFFVELKAQGKKETPDQLREQRKLRKQGCTVYSTVDSLQKIKDIIELEIYTS